MSDRTMEAAKWLYDANTDFSAFKTEQSWQHLQSVMVLAKLFFMANGPKDLIQSPIAVQGGRVYLTELEKRRNELHRTKPRFEGDELHSLKTVLRRFSYAPTKGLVEGLIKAKPFSDHVGSGQPAIIAPEEIPDDFLRSMQAVKKQFESDDFRYKVIKVSGRNFFANEDFDLRQGEYGEIIRAMKEGLIEPDQLYRLSRDKEGNLYAW